MQNSVRLAIQKKSSRKHFHTYGSYSVMVGKNTVPVTRYLRYFAELPSRLSTECSAAECGLPSTDRGPFEGFARTSAR